MITKDIGLESMTVLLLLQRVHYVLVGVDGTSNNVNDIYSSGTLSLNTWYHVGAVRDSPNDEVRFFINGSLDSSVSATLGHTVNDYPLFLGCHRDRNGDPTDLAEGNNDWLMIFNEILSESEIKEIYEDTKPLYAV